MKTMILAAAALSLGVGAAYAQGVPAGYQEPHYGPAAFSDHPNEAQTQFLGPNTVLGKMFRYNSNSGQVAATPTYSAMHRQDDGQGNPTVSTLLIGP
jgi:hypothetical protein